MSELSMRQGVVSIGFAVVVERALGFLSNILLARLLLPQHFGLVTMAATVSEAVNLLGNLGIGSALTHKCDDSEEYANAAFWLGLGVAAGLALLQSILSGWAAAFYRAPLVRPILLTYALGYLFSAFGNVQAALLLKSLRFDLAMRSSVASALGGTLLALGLAAAGFGVWSLVLGRLAGQCISTILNWWLCRWRPSGWGSRRHYRGLVSYGRNLLVSDGLAYVNHNADYLILGQRLGPAVLGVYLFAYNLAMLPVTTITLVVGRVSFPILSRVQRQEKGLQQAFASAVRLSAMLGFPLLLGIVVVADELISGLVGSRWQDAVGPLRLLAVYALGRSVSSHGGQLMNAVGRPDVPMKFNLVYTPIFISALLIGARYGMIGVAAATATISGIATWLYLLAALRVMHWPGRLVLSAIEPAVVAASIMSVTVWVARTVLLSYHPAPLVLLATLAACGMVVYMSALWAFYPDVLGEFELKRHLGRICVAVRAILLRERVR